MNKLTVLPSPQIRSYVSTQKIMLCVCLALLPTVIAAAILHGARALLVVLCCVISAVMFEYIFSLVTKKENTISDLSAAVTGLLLALNLPVTIPLWICSLGSFIAVVIVKQFFGGLGKNFANPAMTARIVLMLSFAQYMSQDAFIFDGVSQATPLSAPQGSFETAELFLGQTAGCIGETCTLTLLIGAATLIALRIISPVLPVAFIGTFAICIAISGNDVVYHLLSGGLVLGAFFMATDYVTSPVTAKGKLIAGVFCGFITFIIRIYANSPEGVSYAILLMNILTPYIDDFTHTKPFGAIRKERKGEADA
ncbi:MAG: RnfABCDGE type electron transport complex subunit D [Oscillospiraceae bacterium]|nr:RnfABCDGE type electron transport complex subunit D [Oscillospiraceae bacterium]